MKLASYIHRGIRSYGIVKPEGIIDLRLRIGQRFNDLKALLSEGGIGAARDFIGDTVDILQGDIRFLPVIEHPDKILCVGMNYADKRREFGQTNPAPTLFVRFADSQTGHNTDILKPQLSCEFDYEGELAIIIGKGGLNIHRDQALSHIAGYSCYMDGSARDWQHAWFTAGKNWRRTGGFGPCLTTADEIDNPNRLSIRTLLNGQTVQQDNTCHMIHSIPSLIEYISTFTRLSAGDVILTGSPGGVGKKRQPPLFLQAGDLIEVEIEGVGHLSNRIRNDIQQPLRLTENQEA